MKNIDNMSGSDIRNYIKQLWKYDNKTYDELINYLLEYDKKDVRNKLIKHCNKNKYTFSEETLKSLLTVFTRFQEEAIQESMSFLDFIIKNLDNGKGSKKNIFRKNTFKKNTFRKNTFKKSLKKKKNKRKKKIK